MMQEVVQLWFRSWRSMLEIIFLSVGIYYGYGYYPYDGYYDSGQYSSSSMWYYCSDPAGYYPYISQCDTGWQPVPGS